MEPTIRRLAVYPKPKSVRGNQLPYLSWKCPQIIGNFNML